MNFQRSSCLFIFPSAGIIGIYHCLCQCLDVEPIYGATAGSFYYYFPFFQLLDFPGCLELSAILLCQPLKYWDYRHEPLSATIYSLLHTVGFLRPSPGHLLLSSRLGLCEVVLSKVLISLLSHHFPLLIELTSYQAGLYEKQKVCILPGALMIISVSSGKKSLHPTSSFLC